jgi:Na+-transporting NADH:ubiquinone oxidoreductase subunit F
LNSQEINKGVRLACQIKVKEDLQIEIPEEIFNIRKFKAEVSQIRNFTYDIKELTLKLIEPNEIDFKAGQYVQLEAPPYEKSKHSVTRAYSIASSPLHKDYIQLIIRRVPDGICTTYIFDYLQQGDNINFTGPFGDFIIRDTQSDMLFVAGGSGKAPIKSMLEYLQNQGSKRRMIYMFGARTKDDLYLTEEFRELEEKLADFTYVPVLSKPKEGTDWQGKTGYIPPYFPEYIKDPQNTEAYLCGSPGMIAAVKKGLLENGVSEDNIYYDSF